VLLSPSKTQDFEIDIELPGGTAPTASRLITFSRQVMEAERQLSRDELHRRLKLSARLTKDVDTAISGWSGRARSGRPAAFAYTGETYRGLAVRELDASALAHAQQRVRILSALYGVLRPLDRIEQYRLDFGVRLSVDGARSLYDYWRERITAQLADDVRESGAAAVVNLASAEFALAVDAQAVGVPFVTPDFLQQEGEKRKRVTVFSKQARGSMARWIVATGIETPEALTDFRQDGYRFDSDSGTTLAPVFVREP
jgi:cytoplasmic iron level regulating protein YaaA (DUF328/UPF0246 family)